jgi:hypothetical protein
MISRSGFRGSEIEEYLNAAERGLIGLNEQSPKDVVDETMKREGKRLDTFLVSRMFETDKLLNTGLIPQLQIYGSYFSPPLARPMVKIIPPDSYYLRNAPTHLLKHPGFHPDLVIPKASHCAALEIEALFIAPYPFHPQPILDLDFTIHYESTMTAFKWLFQEWRRPIGQLLRGLPNLELWGNGTAIDPPQNDRTKDPAALLQYHFDEKKSRDDNMVSMKCSFSAENTDHDIVVTVAVFLCFFDAIYRITNQRADADRLFKYYQVLIKHLPKAPFRKTMVFPKESASH